MLIFISWSGDRSRLVAVTLQSWLGQVIQAVDPWISADIAKGARWGPEVAARLEQSRVGIICLTKDNLDSRWILFEAGALSKTNDAYVCTFLLDIDPSDVQPPLGQFQHTSFDREDVFRLVQTINSAVGHAGSRALSDSALAGVFGTFWPQLEEQLQAIVRTAPTTSLQRSQDDILNEVLASVRNLERRYSIVEERELRERTVARKVDEFRRRGPGKESWAKELVRSVIELEPDDAAEAVAFASYLRERAERDVTGAAEAAGTGSRPVGRDAPTTTCANCKRDFEPGGSVAHCPNCGFKQYD